MGPKNFRFKVFSLVLVLRVQVLVLRSKGLDSKVSGLDNKPKGSNSIPERFYARAKRRDRFPRDGWHRPLPCRVSVRFWETAICGRGAAVKRVNERARGRIKCSSASRSSLSVEGLPVHSAIKLIWMNSAALPARHTALSYMHLLCDIIIYI